MIYENGTLSKILIPDGYITLSGTTPTYHYYLHDHQGNNRVVVKQDGSVEEVSHYYPYGGLFGESVGTNKQNYKFGGKELDRMHGLDWSDFGGRYMRFDVPGWTSVDPLCEKYYSISPYAYCAGNPVKYRDPDGKAIETVWDIYSLATGAKSFVDNFKAGNVVGAIVDGVGIVADAVAVAVPGVPGGAGAAIKGIRTVDKAVDAVRTADKVSDAKNVIRRFDGGLDTKSVSSKEALRNAKDQNGIPRSQQPDKTIKPNTPEGKEAKLSNRNVKQYEYTNSKGEKVIIRQDKAATYNQGGKGDQPAHYNAGKDEKLKQHHNYDD